MQWGFSKLSDHDKLDSQIGNHNNTVLCAINTGTDRRRRRRGGRDAIVNNLKKNNIINSKIPSSQYYKNLSNYKFIISPEGNGIDCHRHYEALMAGCIPIIEHNTDMKRKYSNMPILYTKDYSEITDSYLLKKYDEFNSNKYDFSKLFVSNHTEESQKQIKKHSDFWCKKRTNKTYY